MEIYVKAKVKILRHPSSSDCIKAEEITQVKCVNCNNNTVTLILDKRPDMNVSIEIYNTFFEEVEV